MKSELSTPCNGFNVVKDDRIWPAKIDFQLHVMDSLGSVAEIGSGMVFQLHVMDSLGSAGGRLCVQHPFQLHVMDSPDTAYTVTIYLPSFNSM